MNREQTASRVSVLKETKEEYLAAGSLPRLSRLSSLLKRSSHIFQAKAFDLAILIARRYLLN
jgi:hypothetical protein